jgi:hypothetical protein
MSNQKDRRWLGPRIAWASGAILLALGGILLGIVGDPPRVAYAFVIGIGTAAVGCVLILAGIEAVWLRGPSSMSWRDGLTAIWVAALMIVVTGLLLQLLYSDQGAYLFLVGHALPFTLVLAASYFACRALIVRFGL